MALREAVSGWARRRDECQANGRPEKTDESEEERIEAERETDAADESGCDGRLEHEASQWDVPQEQPGCDGSRHRSEEAANDRPEAPHLGIKCQSPVTGEDGRNRPSAPRGEGSSENAGEHQAGCDCENAWEADHGSARAAAV